MINQKYQNLSQWHLVNSVGRNHQKSVFLKINPCFSLSNPVNWLKAYSFNPSHNIYGLFTLSLLPVSWKNFQCLSTYSHFQERQTFVEENAHSNHNDSTLPAQIENQNWIWQNNERICCSYGYVRKLACL